MLDLRATRLDRCDHGVRAVRVNEGPESLRPGLTADRIDLRLRNVHPAAVTDAGRGEELDQIRPVRLGLSHPLPQLLGRAAAALELPERCQEPRAVDDAGSDGLAQRLVANPPDGLNGGEARHQ